jgi:ketosteroid isomerase-like protein
MTARVYAVEATGPSLEARICRAGSDTGGVHDETEQRIREITALWNDQDIERVLPLVHEEVEIDASRRVLNPARYHGVEGVRQMTREILEVWEAWSIEIGRLWRNGDRVLVEGHVTARGKGSGVELRDTYYGIWEFRDGLPAKQIIFVDSDEAFEAAGVERPSS